MAHLGGLRDNGGAYQYHFRLEKWSAGCVLAFKAIATRTWWMRILNSWPALPPGSMIV
jgi:hypothetical protein